MSSGFLSAAERERWQRFPETIPQDDLAVYFLLSDDNAHEVNRQREPFNRLGYALQLCTLRYLGFVPTDFTATPEVVVTFVAEQLGIAPRVLALYDNRRTQSDHRRYVRAYLGFRQATPLDVYALQTWLVARALEHDKPTLLLQLACEKLHREHIVRPGVTRLERFVATAREKAHDETFRQLTPLLTDERKTLLDGPC
jgi:TnpA family transposase